MSTDLMEMSRQISKETGNFTGGPPDSFESVGRHTFQTLLANGLLPSHRLLDFGCGSLRIGYWLVRFLDPGNYYGLEPIERRVQAGIKHLIGSDMEACKKPTFIFNSHNDMGEFGANFDYVLARSVITHACPGMFDKMLQTFAESSPDGTMFASYWRHDTPEVPAAGDSNGHSAAPSWQFWKSAPPPVPWELERYRNMALTPNNIGEGRVIEVADELPSDDMRFIPIVTYSLGKIQEMAAKYGLSAEEDWSLPPVNRQIWIKIRKAS